jgi:hypothetical protein
MRHIPTTSAIVEALQKQAKRLQRKGGGKHTELLDRVARGAGYAHWNHVKLCQKTTEGKRGIDALNEDIAVIEGVALNGDTETTKIIVTGPETGFASLFMFAHGGDAWMLDPEDNMAMCLVWRGKLQPRQIADVGSEIEILWDGGFEIDGQRFMVDTEHPDIGKRAIFGYPIAELQDYLERTRENQQKFADIFDPSASDELTTELIEELVADGWERATLEEAAKRGDRYSRRRKSLLGTPTFGGDWDESIK